MELAGTADFDGVPLRVVGAAHLAVIALSVGRAKDFARVLAMLERQASWQRTRKALSSPEKVRMAEQVRESFRGLRRSGKGGAGGRRPDSAQRGRRPPT